MNRVLHSQRALHLMGAVASALFCFIVVTAMHGSIKQLFIAETVGVTMYTMSCLLTVITLKLMQR